MTRAMRILFLNQYFPPDPAPTGILFREVAEALEAEGHTVDFVAARQDYRPGQQKGGRMAREFVALGRMLIDGLRRPRAEVVISALASTIRSSVPKRSRCTGPMAVITATSGGHHRQRSAISPGP